jgi:D-aminoacyl-tRNA deacylase
MRAVAQRVLEASVEVDGEIVARIGPGLLVLVGVGKGDTDRDADIVCLKLLQLRVFPDDEGKMNLNVEQAGGGICLVSQFTLFGDVRKGNRPAFDGAETPDEARRLFEKVAAGLMASGAKVQTGRFRAHMKVSSVNDGPVTILIDSRKLF